jgi:Tfp pilus assembly protein PilF
MFKIRTMVISVWSAFAIAGCASLEQPFNKTVQASARPQGKHGELSSEQLYQMGRQYQSEGRNEEAVATYVNAIKRDHSMAEAHNALGVLYAEEGRYDDAISEFKTAIELKPGVAYLHNNLGYALLLRGSNQEALNPLEIARRLEPADEKVLFNLCLAHERLGDLAPQSSRTANAAGTTLIKPATEPNKSRMQTETNSGQLTAVAPGVYEIKLPARIQPEFAAVSISVVKEKASPPPPSQLAEKSRPFKVEISNGNGTPGLARRIARMLDQNGVHPARVTNHVNFRQANTKIEYRKGYLPEASRLRQIFAAEVIPESSSSLRSDIHVRILLGKDLSRVTTLRLHPTQFMVVAHAVPAQLR